MYISKQRDVAILLRKTWKI